MAAASLDTVARSLTGQVRNKLGRCAACMRQSAALAAGALAMLATMAAIGAPAVWVLLAATVAAVSSGWLVAHLTAYLVRGPQPLKGCRTCAERAAALQRRRRWRRLQAWLLRQPQDAPRQRKPGCRHCHKTPVDDMQDSPAAAQGLQHVAEQSVEFQRLLPRLASPDPADTWQADMLHYFLYELVPDERGRTPNALFVARWEDDAPVAAVLVVTDQDNGSVEHIDLRTGAAIA